MESVNNKIFYILDNNEIEQVSGGACSATSNVTYSNSGGRTTTDANGDLNCEL